MRPCLCRGDCPGRSGETRMTGETCRTRSWTCRRWWRGSPPGWSLTPRTTSPTQTLILCPRSLPLTGILPLCHQSCQQPLLDFGPDGKIQRIFSLNYIIIFLRNLYLYLAEHCKLLAYNLFPTSRSCAQKTLLNILWKQGSSRVISWHKLIQVEWKWIGKYVIKKIEKSISFYSMERNCAKTW